LNKFKVNSEIRAKDVILIDAEGNNVGLTPLNKALDVAAEKELDLVQVSENDGKCICKVMDYKKFIYEQKKKDRRNKKPKHEEVMKEFQFRPNIDPHDLETKTKKIKSLLDKKYRVKVYSRLFGRQVNQKEKAMEILKQVYENVTNQDLPQGALKFENNYISLYISAPKS